MTKAYALSDQITVSKLEVAKRQLQTACELYFAHGDPVSIHTLASAAYEVLGKLLFHHRGEKPLIDGAFLEMVRPEHRAKFRRSMREHANFFKHADTDPEATLSFSPDLPDIRMWEACEMYEKLSGERVPVFFGFATWFYSRRLDILSDELPEERRRSYVLLAAETDRRKFFAMVQNSFHVKNPPPDGLRQSGVPK